MKKNFQIYGIASGICAEKYGAQLGVWDLFYSMHNIYKQLKMTEVFYSDSNKSKLAVIGDITILYKKVYKYLLSNSNPSDKYLFYTGDHANAMGVWSSVSNLYKGDFGLIWVDAHLDSHTPKTSDSKNVHGMPVAHLMGYGDKRLTGLINNKIKPTNLCFIGTRDYEPAEQELMNYLGIKVFYMEDIAKYDIDEVFEEAVHHVSKNTNYFGVSIDMDSMSPEFTPGTGCFNPNGLNPEDIAYNLSIISDHPKFKCLELTEYNPIFDIDKKTYNVMIELSKAILDI